MSRSPRTVHVCVLRSTRSVFGLVFNSNCNQNRRHGLRKVFFPSERFEQRVRLIYRPTRFGYAFLHTCHGGSLYYLLRVARAVPSDCRGRNQTTHTHTRTRTAWKQPEAAACAPREKLRHTHTHTHHRAVAGRRRNDCFLTGLACGAAFVCRVYHVFMCPLENRSFICMTLTVMITMIHTIMKWIRFELGWLRSVFAS